MLEYELHVRRSVDSWLIVPAGVHFPLRGESDATEASQVPLAIGPLLPLPPPVLVCHGVEAVGSLSVWQSPTGQGDRAVRQVIAPPRTQVFNRIVVIVT